MRDEDIIRERERERKSPVSTVWITRIVQKVEEEVAVLFASILPQLRRRRRRQRYVWFYVVEMR